MHSLRFAVKTAARRKFSAGLLIAFIDFLTALSTPALELESYNDLVKQFERQTRTGSGARANTLIVRVDHRKTLSIRPFYNAAERYFRAEKKRFDYPSCAPHATQAWRDYISWIDTLVKFSQEDLLDLRNRVRLFVLSSLKSQEVDLDSIVLDPPLFKILLQEFDLFRHKYEPTGAAFQGIVFGFLRADNPHLQMEVSKVRAGSKRLQRIGDVDGWDGGRLAISAEVKQYKLATADVADLVSFANATKARGAIGIVAALEFAEGIRAEIADLGVIPMDKADMLQIISFWDTVKQRIAITSLFYYIRHVEKTLLSLNG